MDVGADMKPFPDPAHFAGLVAGVLFMAGGFWLAWNFTPPRAFIEFFFWWALAAFASWIAGVLWAFWTGEKDRVAALFILTGKRAGLLVGLCLFIVSGLVMAGIIAPDPPALDAQTGAAP